MLSVLLMRNRLEWRVIFSFQVKSGEVGRMMATCPSFVSKWSLKAAAIITVQWFEKSSKALLNVSVFCSIASWKTHG